jgi:hypothetical protein
MTWMKVHTAPMMANGVILKGNTAPIMGHEVILKGNHCTNNWSWWSLKGNLVQSPEPLDFRTYALAFLNQLMYSTDY